MIRNKYKCGSNNMLSIDASRPGSNFWRGLCSTWHLTHSNLIWRVRDGATVRFWEGRWIPKLGLIKDLAISYVPEEELDKSIKSFVNHPGQWDINRIQSLLPTHVVDSIIAMKAPHAELSSDQLEWSCTNDGYFSTTSAYNAIRRHNVHPHSFLFSGIWSWYGPKRVRLFLWKAAHLALLTNAERRRRHLTQSSSCPVCCSCEETLFTLFRTACSLWRFRLDFWVSTTSLSLSR